MILGGMRDPWCCGGLPLGAHGDGELLLPPECMQGSIKPDPERDFLSGKRTFVSAGEDLIADGAIGKRHVMAHGALLLDAQDVVEIQIPHWTVDIRQAVGACKTRIVLVDVLVLEKTVRLLDRRDVPIPQRLDQPVLVRPIRTFDQALGLGVRAKMISLCWTWRACANGVSARAPYYTAPRSVYACSKMPNRSRYRRRVRSASCTFSVAAKRK